MFRRWIIPALAISILGCSSISEPETDSKPISHDLWDDLVKTHVHESGLVDYKGFQEDSARLKKYLAKLENHHPNNENWSREEQMAYWINAYNAFTVELILQHYPVNNIKNIVSGPNIPFVNSPWDIQFITIEGQEYDLNNIEHGILRENFEEPRIHFAINCASISCPILRKEAYRSEKLDKQLQEQAYTFINNPSKNKINQDRIVISRIFKWFSGDFTQDGTLIEYINQYTSTAINPDAEVDYMDYDWGLNEIGDRQKP